MPMSPRLLRPRASGDPDAGRYIAAVQAADGQALEPAVRQAIEAFVRGCKRDGIWSSIKASCILMGARTLSGALTPLVGSAPTNNNFVSGDYNRKTGLLGDGTTKWLNPSRNENNDGLNDNHYALWADSVGTSGVLIGNANALNTSMSPAATRNRTSTADLAAASAGFYGMSRSASASYIRRNGGSSATVSISSFSGADLALGVFANGTGSIVSNARIAFYSMGSALNLSQLDSRLSTLVTAIGAAIP